MKTLLIIALLGLSGCGTIRGFGSLVKGVGSDMQDASDGYNRQYYEKHNDTQAKRKALNYYGKP